MYGYIYKTTNLINGKIYIGQHKTSKEKLDEKYFGSGLYLSHALNYYGKENFTCEIIEWCNTKCQLDDREAYWRKYMHSQDPAIGYNVKDGGCGGFEHIDSSGEHNPMYGIHRFGADNPNFGNKWSDNSRKHMSDTIAINGGHYGIKNPMYGKHQSEEAKDKMRKAKLDENGEYKYKGAKSVNFGKHEDHPCFGLHWWSDGINKPIKSKECPGPAYHRGRK